jgi:hypothetical protein
MTSAPASDQPDERNYEPALKPAHGVSISAPGSQDYAALDPTVKHTVVGVNSLDGARTKGILFEPADRRPKTAVIWSHPSADLLQWWLAPYWVEAGYAAFSFATRYMNNFTDCIHERCLLDIGGAMRYLREEAGFEQVVMFGKSGGASLFAYYQAEATTPVGSRVTAPPGGGSPDLNQFDLIPADGMIFTAGHPGQGKFLERVIDPSVVDENDPLATDPDLDMYDPRNGYRRPPETTRYDATWVERYREAQLARVARIDAIARSAIEGAAAARDAIAAPGFADLPPSSQRALERRAEIPKILTIYRTEANPGYVDLTIDPSDRKYGSIQSTNLDLHNYGLSGFARILTANAWLSTWSGISSNANLARNLPKISEPSYFVFPTGDEDIYPSQFQDQADSSGADDKEVDWLKGFNHNLLLPGEASPDNARRQVMDLLLGWTTQRFAAN